MTLKPTFDFARKTLAMAAMLTACLSAVPACAQQIIRLWDRPFEGAREVEQIREDGERIITDVVDPTLTVYLPDPAIANGTAVIIAPGGAMRRLGVEPYERSTARWLNLRGALDVPVDQTGSAENSSSGASTSDCDEGETADTGVESVPECVPEAPRSDAVATLKADVITDIHADGTLSVRTQDCSYLLDVTMDLDDGGAEPDTGSQPHPGDDTGSQPCGDGADCG